MSRAGVPKGCNRARAKDFGEKYEILGRIGLPLR